MNRKKDDDDVDESGLGHDPLSSPLLETLYGASDARRDVDDHASEPRQVQKQAAPAAAKVKRGRGNRRPLPDGKTYRLVTFSFYEDDVDLLDALLAEAKKRRVRGASRSLIMRLALRQVNIDALKDRL